MLKKLLIPLYGNDVAPRFDLATEVLIATIEEESATVEEKTVVLPHASPEDLCHLILTEKVDVVICGGIEEEYYQYLRWKKVRVMDSVIGSHRLVLKRFMEKGLSPGDILREEMGGNPQ